MNQVLCEMEFSSGQQLQIVEGDITEERVNAIVNPANANLIHGGGVAGLIVRKGGAEIQVESNEWIRQHGPVRHADPAYTGAGKLPCQYIIHAVGPVWGEGEEDVKLASAVMGSLRVAESLKLESLALPAISTGLFGFPKERAAEVIYNAVEDYFTEKLDSGIRLVRLTLYDQPIIEAFLDIWRAEKGNGA